MFAGKYNSGVIEIADTLTIPLRRKVVISSESEPKLRNPRLQISCQNL